MTTTNNPDYEFNRIYVTGKPCFRNTWYQKIIYYIEYVAMPSFNNFMEWLSKNK